MAPTKRASHGRASVGPTHRTGRRPAITRKNAPGLLAALIGSHLLGCWMPDSGQDGPPNAPALALEADREPPIRAEVTFRATPTAFHARQVAFFFDSEDGAPAHVDTEPPFEWLLDTETVPDGPHELLGVAEGPRGRLEARLTFVVRNRPNIVFVLVDDLDETDSPFLDAMPHTVERLAEGGLRFTNSFAPDPVCAPARATALTGRYAHNTGVFDITPPDGGYPPFLATQEEDTVATRLQAAGYRTAFLGKYINGYFAYPTHVPVGWDEWFGIYDNVYAGYDYAANHNGEDVRYGHAPEDYQADVLTGLALTFLESTETEDDQPFLLFLSPPSPHWPMPPAPRHLVHPWVEAFQDYLPNYNEADVSDKVTWLREGMASMDAYYESFNLTDYRSRMGALMSLDDMVGAVFEALADAGELEQTVVFFSSDNGYNLGAHRLLEKSAPYEESIRVPLFVAGRDVLPGEEARFVNQTDLAPTFLDLAGEPHDDLDGYSMVPLLRGENCPWRTDELLEYRGTFGHGFGVYDTFDDVTEAIASGVTRLLMPSYRAVRTEDALFIEWYRGDVHEYELFDLANDPYQLENLLATPEGMLAHAVTTNALMARLEALASCAGPTCR